jgi:hypothetical protein
VEEDAELANDLVGVASARLLAAGVHRGDRLGALRLLGILTGVADHERRVRRPIPEVALEFALPPGLAEEWAGHLEAVGVIRREGDSTVVAGAEPAYIGAMRLHDFLDAAAELDAAPRRAPGRALRPIGAALAAAAMLAVVLSAPGMLRNDNTPVSSSREVPASTGTTARPATDATADAGSGSAGTTATPGPGASTVGPVTTLTSLLPACPAGIPVLEVLGTTTDATGRLAVDGLATNGSDTPMTIEGFTLQATVAGVVVEAEGLDRPLTVPARSSVNWQSRLPAVAPAGTLVTATLGDWSWNAMNLPQSCSTP